MTRRFLAVSGTLALATGSMVIGLGGAVAAETQSETFEYTGAAQQFVVPANVCTVAVDAYGAEGGDFGGPITAGRGGRATATVDVTPGEALAVYVGGRPVGTTGGFNGGGDAGHATNNGSDGAAGGGASDVRQGGVTLADRIVVAGGGGGRNNGGGEGGAGGGENGLAGTGLAPGSGGTQVAGGTSGGNGGNGGAGIGGAGGEGFNIAGGGGGGGWFGGAGGGGAPEGNADLAGGGGGGSGHGPAGTVFETGVREGDGLVAISWDAGSCPQPPPGPAPAPAAVAAPRFTG